MLFSIFLLLNRVLLRIAILSVHKIFRFFHATQLNICISQHLLLPPHYALTPDNHHSILCFYEFSFFPFFFFKIPHTKKKKKKIPHISEIMHCLFSFVWLISFSLMFSRFILVGPHSLSTHPSLTKPISTYPEPAQSLPQPLKSTTP